MGFYLLHSGAALQAMTTAGVVSTVTPPVGITVVTTRRARIGLLNRLLLVTNAPSRNLLIDLDLNAYILPSSPTVPATATANTGPSQLSGIYQVAYSYAVKKNGVVIAETNISPIGSSPTLANDGLNIGFGVSADSSVNCRRLYRSTSGGTALYWLRDINNNTTTSYLSTEPDAALGEALTARTLGDAPGTSTSDRMSLLVAWKDRLWGISSSAPDYLRFCGSNAPWAWATSQSLLVAPAGEDAVGVNGFLPRRDELVVGKVNSLWKVVGDSVSTFRMIKVMEGIGIVAPDSCVVIRDVGFFLGNDGVYTIGPEGLRSISDENVKAWFTTDTYFNRAAFSSAFARYNPRTLSYELHLPAVGGTDINRWLQYDLRSGRWFGPHKTLEMTPTFGGPLTDANGNPLTVIASSGGFLYNQNQSDYQDGTYEIPLEVVTQPFTGDQPDRHKYFGDLSVLTMAQEDGYVEVTPTLDAETQTPVLCPLDANRTRLRRIGVGRLLTLKFANDAFEQNAQILGFEIPVHTVGRR